jgi:cell fate regulator YaaT (PSP1 superfamily)
MENEKQNNKAPEAGAPKSDKGRRPHHHRPHKKPEQKTQDAQAQQAPKAQAPAPEQQGKQPKQQPKQNPPKKQQPQQKQNQPKQGQPSQQAVPPVGDGKKKPKRRNGQKQGRDGAAQEPVLQLPEDISISELKQIVKESKQSQQTPVVQEALPLADASILESIPTHSTPTFAPDEAVTEVVGVRFKEEGKVYYFAPGKLTLSKGDAVIVETARGPEYGTVWVANRQVRDSEIVKPLKEVLRGATPEDLKHHKENKAKEAEAFRICGEKIAQHGLDMKLVEAQYTFDNSKLLFYFTSAGRVDFRELVKDLASVFRTRIELRQIGIRDEAKLMGGIGVCGRPFCCKTFLPDFNQQVSIKMAKEQNLSLNSSKISGACGRLMCCLRYEYETYLAESAITPKVDAIVATPEGDGVVTESIPLKGIVKVALDRDPTAIRVYHRDDLTVKGFQKGKHKTVGRNAEKDKQRSENASEGKNEGKGEEKRSERRKNGGKNEKN